MRAWSVHGVELPHGNEPGTWWIDTTGGVHHRPLAGADPLPGAFILPGLADAHAHPAVAPTDTTLVALDEAGARANLGAWARAGITVIRDVGSPRGLTLDLRPEPGMPAITAAGRFLAPADHYFPDLLDRPVDEASLVSAALAEIGRGASWVKVIADFPDLATGSSGAEVTYGTGAIARVVAAAHRAGARVAVHATLPAMGKLVAAGVDSIEHGFQLDEQTLTDMARRGTAWTPTLSAMFANFDTPGTTPQRRRRFEEIRERMTELLPLAVRLGVPVLAGSDITGSIPREVALLTRLGLEPSDALAAASTTVRRFLGTPVAADIVTYHHDPREDPDELARPAAVVAGGVRLH